MHQIELNPTFITYSYGICNNNIFITHYNNANNVNHIHIIHKNEFLLFMGRKYMYKILVGKHNNIRLKKFIH